MACALGSTELQVVFPDSHTTPVVVFPSDIFTVTFHCASTFVAIFLTEPSVLVIVPKEYVGFPGTVMRRTVSPVGSFCSRVTGFVLTAFTDEFISVTGSAANTVEGS